MVNKIETSWGEKINWLASGGAALAGIALAACAGIVCYEVVLRYIFNSPTEWTLDLSVYLTIWFAYGSMAYVQKEGRHVSVDVFIIHLSPRVRAIWDIVIAILYLFFSCMLLYYGTEFTIQSIKMHEYSREMWRVIIWPVKLAIPIGGFLLVLILLKELIDKIHYFLRESFDLDKEVGFFSRSHILIPLFIAALIIGFGLFKAFSIIGMAVFLVIMLFSGVPIFPTLGLVGASGIFLHAGGLGGLNACYATISFGALANFALVALPLYILVGQILQSAGVGEELYDFASKWLGHLPGGESAATIVACSIFAAISSSSVATAVTIGLVALPALAARKYNKPFSYGLLAAGGTLGIMIPPSGAMIIYSMVTEESLGKLFLAGMVPGLILSGGFIGWAVFRCWRTGEYEKRPKASWKVRYDSLKTAFWGLMAPVIILGGIYSGICTPLESGALAVAYALVMVAVRGKVKIRDIPKVLADSTLGATMVMSIVVSALVLGTYMTLQQIPQHTLDFVLSLNLSRWGVVAGIFILLTVLGMFLEVISVMLITLPVIYPLVIGLGFNGLWFAVFVTLTMEMALLTPPVGLNLYVITGISQAHLTAVLRGVIPFFIIMLLGLILFCLFPSLSTWLPNMMITR